MSDAYIGTGGGVLRLGDGGLEPLGLDAERVSALHARREDDGTVTLLAGTYGSGLFRRGGGEPGWSRIEDGLTAPVLRWLGPDPADPDAMLAGTEPARLFRGEHGGRRWRELEGITEIDGHDRWFLPYSPRAGALRNVYAPPGRPGRLLAAVEVAGLVHSEDRGEEWSCRPVMGDEDIHQVTGHPHDPELIFVALGTASITDDGRPHGGVARSRDGGASWERIEADYTRSVLVPPTRPDLLVAGPAGRVGRQGRIVVSEDGGDTWTPAGDGLEIPMADMVELFVPAPDGSVWAICSRGRLLRAEPGRWTWSSALPEGSGLAVESVAFA